MPPERLRGLYAITPQVAERQSLFDQVEAALRGGCRILQFRDKSTPPAERVARARRLRQLTTAYGARLLINDDLALCIHVGADGVHLGADDGNLSAARAILGPHRLLGASCYNDPAKAATAAGHGVDYVAFGAVFPSPTKPQAARAGLALFARTPDSLSPPRCAIGGITLATAPTLIAAGADLLAVITDLFSASDIAARAAAYQSLFEVTPA